MRNKVVVLATGIMLVFAASALAHHPFDSQFDWKKPTTMTGTVTKITWASPHTMVYIDARDESGNTGNWSVELAPPGVLSRYGLNRNALKVGDQITVDGWMAKDGSKFISAKSVTLPNGHQAFAGSSFFNAAQASRPVATTGTAKKSETAPKTSTPNKSDTGNKEATPNTPPEKKY